MGFLENLLYVLVGFIGLVAIFLIVLSLIEKKLYKKFLSNKYGRNHHYIEKLSKINVKKPEEGMNSFDKTAKNFFREAFHIKGSPGWSQLQKYFEEKNNKKGKEIAEKMIKYNYSGAKVTSKDLQNMIRLLAEIVSSNKILTKDMKRQLDKKSMQKQPWEKRSKIGKIVRKFKD